MQRIYSQLDQSGLALANDRVEVVGGQFEHVRCQRSADGQYRRQESPESHDVRRDENKDGDESGEKERLGRVDGGSQEPLSLPEAENRSTWSSLSLIM